MAIWDIAAWTLEKGYHNPGNALNTSYSGVLGDNINFTMGGGYFQNTFGMTNGVICDLEDLLAQKLEAKGLAGIVGAAFLFGSGGNTNLLVGGDTSFKYYGHDLVINRGRHQLYFKSDDDTVIPLLVMVLGLAGLLAAALVLRFVYKAQMKGDEPHEHAIELASLIIPTAETRFLALLKLTECALGLKAAKKVLEEAEAAVAAARQLLTTATDTLADYSRLVVQIQFGPPVAGQINLAAAQAQVQTQKGVVAQATKDLKIKQMAVTNQTAALAGAWLGQTAHH
jgi:hypothetical protein